LLGLCGKILALGRMGGRKERMEGDQEERKKKGRKAKRKFSEVNYLYK
jgi:hypothetical protein